MSVRGGSSRKSNLATFSFGAPSSPSSERIPIVRMEVGGHLLAVKGGLGGGEKSAQPS